MLHLGFYAGLRREGVARLRVAEVKLDQVLDAAPVQSWSVLAGKFATLTRPVLGDKTDALRGAILNAANLDKVADLLALSRPQG
jgi:hypothetical protein